MKNLKTTIFGAIGALGVYLTSQTDPIVHVIGQVLSFVGSLGAGYFAADASGAAKS